MPDAQSNVMTVDGAGNVGADFSGHVSAQGLDLNAEPFVSGATVPKNSVNWIRRSDGAYVAEITASDNGDMRYDTSGIAGTAEHLLRAADTSGNLMGLEVGTDHVSTWASASTTPGGFVERTLLSAAGATDFVRTQTATRFRLTFGAVNGNNTIANSGTADWTLGTHTVNGTYTINFNPAFTTAMFVASLTPLATNRFVTVQTTSLTSAVVYFPTAVNGAGVDTAFTFLVVGF